MPENFQKLIPALVPHFGEISALQYRTGYLGGLWEPPKNFKEIVKIKGPRDDPATYNVAMKSTMHSLCGWPEVGHLVACTTYWLSFSFCLVLVILLPSPFMIVDFYLELVLRPSLGHKRLWKSLVRSRKTQNGSVPENQWKRRFWFPMLRSRMKPRLWF